MSDRLDDRTDRRGFDTSWIGMGLLLVAFVVSAVVATINTLRIERPSKTVIRIAHWQLERGYREAMQKVIDEYEKLHPDVTVEQMPVTERVYPQWLNTHLIAGTAPDLCELGMARLTARDDSTVRYFLPLSGYITRPNPYNRGTDLEGVPWKETLADGMRGGFRDGLQEYYGVPTTIVSMRLYYNRDLLREVTGSDDPPRSFGHWMEQCRQVREYARRTGRRILPVVSCYAMGPIQQKYEVSFTAAYEQALDLDLNGDVTEIESYIGLRNGVVTLDDPAIQAMFQLLRRIGEHMQQGFSAMDRQEAQFKFANAQAAFMFTGSWDASGTVSQASRKGFSVGICDLPLPAPGEEFAEHVLGRANEAATAGASVYGVHRGSRHVEQAIDFLMFLTSRSGNELMNRESEWPPLTLGARPSELMQPFMPDPRGFNARVWLGIGSRVRQVFESKIVNFYQGDDPFSVFREAYNAVIVDPQRGGDWAWWFEYDQRRRDTRNKERVLALDAALELIEPGTRDPARYRRMLLLQVIRNNAMDYLWLFRAQRRLEPTEAWKSFQPVLP